MEVSNRNELIESESLDNFRPKTGELFEVNSNWVLLDVSKRLSNAISTCFSTEASPRLNVDDIAEMDGSVEIQPTTPGDHCTINFKLKDGFKVIRMGIVSESSLMEVFGDDGEYLETINAEFIDEFEDATVYLSELTLPRPSSEISIKFIRINNNRSTMYLYGIKLILEESKAACQLNDNQSDIDLMNLLKMAIRSTTKSTKQQQHSESTVQNQNDNADADNIIQLNHLNNINNNKHNDDKSNDNNLEQSIDMKLKQMETRLLSRIETFENTVNNKLDELINLMRLK